MFQLFPKSTESRMQTALGALENAREQFQTAIDYSQNESRRHQAEIESLTTVISDKRKRVDYLSDLKAKAGDAWSVLSGIIENDETRT